MNHRTIGLVLSPSQFLNHANVDAIRICPMNMIVESPYDQFMIINKLQLFLKYRVIFEGLCIIKMIIKRRFVGNNQITFVGNRLFKYLHISKHANRNPGDKILRITRFKGINRFGGPGAGDFSLDQGNDLIRI